MGNPVIEVSGLSKKYRIGKREPYKTIRETIMNAISYPARLFKRNGSGGGNTIWALKDVSFEVKEGEVLGIIGRNGAGKTTLLKILSRVTEPAGGEIKIRGRVGSLLEVGTGFHPELTGRENIFLNGAILGMRKEEIKQKFGEIVDFAEIEKFLDTPVKRYSSGMYVRLAFAVAAHLDPEILIMDEVLAVGDIQFQKKCLGKLEEVAAKGKTVLLVSHNMASIVSLSTKCILLSEGKLTMYGLPSEVVSAYQNNLHDETYGQTDLSEAEHYGNGKARFLSIFMRPLGKNGEILPMPTTGCNIEIEVRIKAYSELKDTTVAIIIYDQLGNRLIDVNTLVKGDSLSMNEEQVATVNFLLNKVYLKPDIYTAGLWLGILNNADIDGIRYATSFRMEARREDVLYTNPFPGVYTCEFEHEIQISQ